jgi:hypothetical protein
MQTLTTTEEETKERSVLEDDLPREATPNGEHREPTEGERPEEIWQTWFGDADATFVTFTAELRPSPLPGVTHELHVGGEPLSHLLEPEDLPYYRNAFLPELLQGTVARWRGEMLPTHGILEGCVAARKGSRVDLTYGERVEHPAREHVTDARPRTERQRADVPDQADAGGQPFIIELDTALRQSAEWRGGGA